MRSAGQRKCRQHRDHSQEFWKEPGCLVKFVRYLGRRLIALIRYLAGGLVKLVCYLGEYLIVAAILSAVFAALTSILAKIGIEGVNSNLATALRPILFDC